MTAAAPAMRTAFPVLLSLGACHLLNDTIQALLPAIYPVLEAQYDLSFTQIGLMHMAFQGTASILQPAVGIYTDRHPMPRVAVAGMGASLAGLLILSVAGSYAALLLSAMAIGLGSAVFHPEAARAVRRAAGTRFGTAQSIFQVGGNAGTALGPLLAAFVVLPFGQPAIAGFAALAVLAMILLWRVGGWVRANAPPRPATASAAAPLDPVRRRIFAALLTLIFAKYVYMAALTSFYTFYLIETFAVSVRDAQLLLFGFLAAVAVGTMVGGPLGDRLGRLAVIRWSILGIVPFAMALPYAGLAAAAVLSVLIGLMLASAFPALVVYGQALMPERVGLVSGLFFGFAFGVAGVSAALLGVLADATSIATVFRLCAVLPLLGLLALRLPPEEDLPGAA